MGVNLQRAENLLRSLAAAGNRIQNGKTDHIFIDSSGFCCFSVIHVLISSGNSWILPIG